MEKYKKELLKIIVSIKSTKFLEKFLRDILTPKEFREIVKRWQIVKLLFHKFSQRDIQKKLKVSISKISRGSRVLLNKNSAFNKLLKKTK